MSSPFLISGKGNRINRKKKDPEFDEPHLLLLLNRSNLFRLNNPKNVLNFYSPESKTILVKVGFDPCYQSVTFIARQCFWKKLHHFRISIEGCERTGIGLYPFAKSESICLNLWY